MNLNHYDATQQLLWQTVAEEKGADIVINAEPYRVSAGNGNWITDRFGNVTANWTTGKYRVHELVSTIPMRLRGYQSKRGLLL